MTDDIKALREALGDVTVYMKGGFSYNPQEYLNAANPLRIARLLDALEAATRDAERYRWLRDQHWSTAEVCAVMDPKCAVKIGYTCPSGEYLDIAIDEAMKGTE